MKALILVLTFIGMMAVCIGYINQIRKCPPPKVVYRYIPRTFEDDQNNPVSVLELFNSMFMEPSTWLRGVYETTPKDNELNRYYISQA
jgi:hypothetical protein